MKRELNTPFVLKTHSMGSTILVVGKRSERDERHREQNKSTDYECISASYELSGGPEEGRWVRCGYGGVRECESSVRSHDQARRLSALATDAACQLDILRHDRDALGVDGAQVGVLEEADEVGLRRLLQRGTNSVS